jgi:transcriptional regulator of acetoin/glycerol metabolism
MADLERDLLRKALQIYGSAAEVAVHFNVDRSTIFRKLKKYALR